MHGHEHVVEDLDGAIEIGLLDIERRQHAHDFFRRAVDDEPAIARAVDDRRRVERELQPAHQAGAADLFDHGMLERERAQLALEVGAHLAHVIEHVREVGVHFERQLRALALKHSVIEEVRGAGLMRGLQLTIDATPIIDGARDRGLIVNRTSEKVVRMLPPLNIEKADLDRAVEILDDVFASVPAEVGA